MKRGFDESSQYSSCGGSKYSELLHRQRELPFGQKLQNHALNHRLNQEFKKYFPTCDYVPVIRELQRISISLMIIYSFVLLNIKIIT